MPDDRSAARSPDEAFAVLGSEPRLQILQALCAADGPLAYAELFDRVAYDDPGNFPYHLDRLVGGFVRRTERGYVPRLPARRVVDAIYAGVMTDDPVIDRTPVDMSCMYCGGPAEVAYYDGVAVVYCGDCEGRLGRRGRADDWPIPTEDVVGYVNVLPAGVYGRSPLELIQAAGVLTIAELQAVVREVCPRCSAALERTADVCEDHQVEDGFCSACDHRFGVHVAVSCTNCLFRSRSPYPTHALGNLDLVAFMADRGIDPFDGGAFHLAACEEVIDEVEPLSARYTFADDGAAITLTVDGGLTVTETTRHSAGDDPA